MIHRIGSAVASAVLAVACLTIGTAGAQTKPAATPQGKDDPVVAIVGDESIHLSELMSAKQSMQKQELRDAPLEMVYSGILDQLVERRVVTQAAVADSIEDDPDVRLRVARARENVILEAYISKRLEPEMTEEKLRARYQQQIASAGGEEEVHARHILLETEADARAVLSEIAKGAEFTELAKQRSKGPSAPRGGDLGFFRRQQMVPAFSEAAFALAPDQVSEPVKTQFGWHIIQVVAKRKAQPPPFEQVAEGLRNEVAREAVLAIVADLRSKAKVQLFNPDGTPLVMPKLIQPTK
jgi:peptidyl-prolyl cis-trans isomerase C